MNLAGRPGRQLFRRSSYLMLRINNIMGRDEEGSGEKQKEEDAMGEEMR